MAIDLDTILRKFVTRVPSMPGVGTAPAAGQGATGLGMGGYNAGGGADTQFKASNAFSVPNTTGAPNYGSVDDMAFDSQYQTQWDSLQRQLADATSQFSTANQQDEEEYQRATRAAGQQNELDIQGLIDRMANQGLLRSGINVKAQGDLAKSHQNRLADYERQKTQARTNRQTGFAQLQRQIQDNIAILQQEKARREQARQEEAARKEAERLKNEQPQVTPTGQFTISPGDTPINPQGLTFNPGQNSNLPVQFTGPGGQALPGGNRVWTPESPTINVDPLTIKRALKRR